MGLSRVFSLAAKALFLVLLALHVWGCALLPITENEAPPKKVIVLDPGHGGEELGAFSPVKGIHEKEVVLNIAKKLADKLSNRLDVHVVLTRTGDENVSLADRTKIANDHHAELFLSIHANASVKKKLTGVETYYLNNTNDQASLKLAERENNVIGGVDDLSFILSDLIQSAKLDDSITFAHYIQESLVSELSAKYRDTKNLGVKKGPFFVLVGAHMPCVLTEVSFIDHPVEGRRLIRADYQERISEALFKAVERFLRTH